MYNRTFLLTTSPPLYRVTAQVRHSMGAKLLVNPPHNGAHAPAFEPPQRIHDCMRTPSALSLHRSADISFTPPCPLARQTKSISSSSPTTAVAPRCLCPTDLALPMQFLPAQIRHLPLQPPVTKSCTPPPSPCRNSPSCAIHTNCTCLGHPLSTVWGPHSATLSATFPCPLPFANAAPLFMSGMPPLWNPL